MDYEKLFRSYLDMSIRFNCLDKYLLGEPPYYVSTDSHYVGSPHAFYMGNYIYNLVNREQPSLHLDTRFTDELLKKLNSNKLGPVDIYCVFKCILAQQMIEDEKKGTLNISSDQMKKLLSTLRSKVLQYESRLKDCKYADGEFKKNGAYEYMISENDKYYNKTGKRIF